jgi:hypothetical protein
MKPPPPETKLQHYIDDLEAKQNNVVWPDTMKNSRSVDKFLWSGSPNPTLVQRIAAWLLGGFLMMIALGLFAVYPHEWYAWLIVCFWWLIGLKIFSNGFPTRK